MREDEIVALETAVDDVFVLLAEHLLPHLVGPDVGNELRAKTTVVDEALPGLEVQVGVVVAVVEEPLDASAVGTPHLRKHLVPRCGDAPKLADEPVVGKVAGTEHGVRAAVVEQPKDLAEVRTARIVGDVNVGDDAKPQHGLVG